MNSELAAEVGSRARGLCEYCLMPQSARRLRFQIEHIVAKQHGGKSILENLALATVRDSLIREGYFRPRR